MSDRAFGVLAGILSVLFLAVAVPSISGDWQTGAGARYFTVGPRLFPYIAGALTLLFAVLLVVKPTMRDNASELRDPAARNNVLLAMAIALGYVALLGVLGFTLTSFLALFAFLVGFGNRNWLLIVPLCVVLPIAVRFMFLKGFALELPAGVLGLPF